MYESMSLCAQETRDPLGRLRPIVQPILDPLCVDLDAVRIGFRQKRVVGTDPFDELAVARTAHVGDHDAIVRALLGAGSG